MSGLEASLVARCRRSYEIGRLTHAGIRVSPLVPLMALALLGCSPSQEMLACAGILLAVVTLLLWRGQEWGVGVGPGIAAGLVPLLLPIGSRAVGHFCLPGSCLLMPGLCAAGGLLGGFLLGLVAPQPRVGRMVPFMVACSVAGLMGAVGCLLYGLVGFVVMAAGLVTGTAGLVVLRRA